MQKAILHLRQSDPMLSARSSNGSAHTASSYREPDFETLVKSIVYQQLSGKVARVIFGRLARPPGSRHHARRASSSCARSRMRTLGLSRPEDRLHPRPGPPHARRQGGVRATARLCPTTEVIERLTQVKGIGVWTAHMFLMFALRRNDMLPTGDLGIRTAIRKAYGLEDLPSPAEMEATGRPLAPLLLGGELVPVAQPGRRRQFLIAERCPRRTMKED